MVLKGDKTMAEVDDYLRLAATNFKTAEAHLKDADILGGRSSPRDVTVTCLFSLYQGV